MKLLGNVPAYHSTTSVKVAIVTGLSDPESTRLSPDQMAFLDAMPMPEECKVRVNFPFLPTRTSDHAPSLAIASWNNGRQFLASQGRHFCDRAKPHWQALCDSTDRLLLVTGSCGHQMIDGIRDCQNVPAVRVLALGSVRLGRCGFRSTRILGRRDWIACWFSPHCEHVLAGVGHLDYWNHETVTGIAANWIRNNLSESLERGATCPRSE